MKKIQKEVDTWINKYAIKYWDPHSMTLRLMEEVGEFAREINHIYGPKKKKSTESKKEISDEIGDLIFTITCIANSLDIDLDKTFKKTMKKLNTRDKDRYTRK